MSDLLGQEAAQQAEAPALPPEPPPEPAQEPVHDDWKHYLAIAIANMPDEIASKMAKCLGKDLLLDIVKSRNDPYLKLAILLLKDVQ